MLPEQAAALEQQARENLKKEAPALAQALKTAQQTAGESAKAAKATPNAEPLKNAELG